MCIRDTSKSELVCTLLCMTEISFALKAILEAAGHVKILTTGHVKEQASDCKPPVWYLNSLTNIFSFST